MVFKNFRKSADLDKVRAGAAGLNSLAMSMVLPHENRPVRFPVTPAALTATIDLMSDRTYPVPNSSSRRAFLCRDAAYPLWVERSLANMSCMAIDTSVIIPSNPNKDIGFADFSMSAVAAGGATIDGVAASPTVISDMTPVAEVNGQVGLYVPFGATFQFHASGYGALVAGGTLELTFEYRQSTGEVLTTVGSAVVSGQNILFSGTAGGAVGTGTLVEGSMPFGFVRLAKIFTGTTSPLATATNGTIRVGWTTGGLSTAPAGTVVAMVPFSNPPEAQNSLLPYTKTRLNASAALFTNVTAALSKEGTVLAARLKSDTVHPWSFTENDLNSVHPKLRYFGPLEKGLYTFTTPSTNQEPFLDKWAVMDSLNSAVSSSQKLVFHPELLGTYNAFIFSDLGSDNNGTQLAASCYVHMEFETVSSLFAPGVSTMTLETLHAAQVALLQFGHFHENPLHFSSIARAAASALRAVAPMLAPVVQHVGTRALNAGVQYLKGGAGGDRGMTQSQMVTPPKGKAGAPQKKKKKAAAKRKK